MECRAWLQGRPSAEPAPFCVLSYASIFSVQPAVHLSVYQFVCLSVGLSVTPQDCLPACLFMSVCVSICISIYLCLYLFFGLSRNKSIHQLVCFISMPICHYLSILSFRPLLPFSPLPVPCLTSGQVFCFLPLPAQNGLK